MKDTDLLSHPASLCLSAKDWAAVSASLTELCSCQAEVKVGSNSIVSGVISGWLRHVGALSASQVT